LFCSKTQCVLSQCPTNVSGNVILGLLCVVAGVTYAFTWVSMCQYTAKLVPSVSLATVQGIMHGVYFGLGNGIGHLIGGLAIDAYGAAVTFYATAVVVVFWLLLFILCQKVGHFTELSATIYQ